MASSFDRIANQAQTALMNTEDPELYARTMQRARIALGSADWRERLRWRLGLPPARWMYESADHQMRMRAIP